MASNPQANPKGLPETESSRSAPEELSREELSEQLYRQYAMGGSSFARFRLRLYFHFKTLLWKIVVGSAAFFKRALDVLGSAVFLILFSPIYLATAIAILLEDGGPVILPQVRVGKWGKPFTMYKYRSMRKDADKIKERLLEQNETEGATFKMKEDPRITKVGKIIRKLSIDELPQLWNVLKGDMSLVGPRPPLPSEVAEYEYSQRRRLEVKSGITCLWQVMGRSDINFEGQIKLDVEYIESRSFLGDISILLKTIPAVILGKGAY